MLNATPRMNSVFTIFLATTWWDIWTTAFVCRKVRLHIEEFPQINTRCQGRNTHENEPHVSPHAKRPADGSPPPFFPSSTLPRLICFSPAAAFGTTNANE